MDGFDQVPHGDIEAVKRAIGPQTAGILVEPVQGEGGVRSAPPSFFKARMTAEPLVRHYKAVADASPVPVLLYNVTMFTGISLPVDALASLSAHQQIAGLKDSGSDLALLGEFIRHAPPPFSVLSGSAATFYPSLCIGATGAVLAVAGALLAGVLIGALLFTSRED